MSVGWALWIGLAWAAPDLIELKKVDFSILLAGPTSPQADAASRCFLRPAVAQALSRVQQRLRLLQIGMRVTRCYQPEIAGFGRGASVLAALVQKEIPGAPKALEHAFASEGFRVENAKKGHYVYRPAEGAPLETTPVAELP